MCMSVWLDTILVDLDSKNTLPIYSQAVWNITYTANNFC